MQTRHLIFALFITTAIVSCKKDSTASSSTTVTTDDAADAVTEAVTPESAGVVAQTQTATVVISTGSFECGVESDTSFSGQNTAGAAITYSYLFSLNRLLTCNTGIPQQFAFAYSGKTSYDAPRISSDDSAQAQFTVTGLQPSASQYVFNQTYTRKGSETSKVGNQLGFTSTITIQTSNLTVDKSTQQILSGSATVSISGATTSGKAFSYTGTLTFNGNKQATLVLGNSNTYNIIWS
jgi:hypothetical protein